MICPIYRKVICNMVHGPKLNSRETRATLTQTKQEISGKKSCWRLKTGTARMGTWFYVSKTYTIQYDMN
jgi:hypothetical protein